MEETRRFLRYVMPGLVFGVEVLALSAIVLPDNVLALLRELRDSDGFAVAVGGLLASGGLGYIFSSIHHSLHWRLCREVDFRQLVRKLRDDEILPSNHPVTGLQSAYDAWAGVLVMWCAHAFADHRERLELLDAKINSLLDVMHASGTAVVASAFALVATCIFCAAFGEYAAQGGPVLRFLGMLAAAIGLICVFLDSYRRTARMAWRVYDVTFRLRAACEREAGST